MWDGGPFIKVLQYYVEYFEPHPHWANHVKLFGSLMGRPAYVDPFDSINH